jgi:outer membrane receptor protein involved in Fe transport
MQFQIDKRIFNAGQDITSTGGSALDVLSNIPSVDVNTEEEISLRGNTGVTVWINGRASGLFTENRSQILSQIPAANIDRVEIITNPSAKYNPEGTAGIINIRVYVN